MRIYENAIPPPYRVLFLAEVAAYKNANVTLRVLVPTVAPRGALETRGFIHLELYTLRVLRGAPGTSERLPGTFEKCRHEFAKL